MLAATLMAAGCNNAAKEGEDDENTSGEVKTDTRNLVFSIPTKDVDDHIYDARPAFTLHFENPDDFAVKSEVKVRITTDKRKDAKDIKLPFEVPAKGTLDLPFTTDYDLAAGFYNANCFVNGKAPEDGSGNIVFGISPTQIVSAPDKQPDYDSFWETALSQLPEINEESCTLTPIPEKSKGNSNVYLVQMKSVPDGLTGDPVTVRGYYCEPKDGKKHPVFVHFFGYDDQKPTSEAFCPSGSEKGYAEFYLSTRGQMVNNRPAKLRDDGVAEDFTNTYGDWFAFHFGDKNSYYYRGAFMDCVQAVRFMATRSTSDMSTLYAEGSSQGGAFTYAAAALSGYQFTAIAPCVAFLGDFPDYFDIVGWPAETARANKGTMTDDEMYAFLSYFDTKNLATRISCPVIAAICLKDQTCPPHTNIAPYNNLKSTVKEIHYYPKLGHAIPPTWPKAYADFFAKQ